MSVNRNEGCTRVRGLNLLLLSVVMLLVTPGVAAAGNGMAALSLLPDSTALVLTVNLARARKSPLLAPYLTKRALARPEFAEFVTLAQSGGVDLQRDLATLIVGMSGDFDTSGNAVIVVEGRIDPAKFLLSAKQAAKKSFAMKSYRRQRYAVIDNRTALLFAGTRMIATVPGNMNAVIDVMRKKRPSLSRVAPFVAALKGVDVSKGAWALLLLPADLRRQVAQNAGGHSIENASLSVDGATGLGLRLKLQASSTMAAVALAMMANAQLAQARQMPQLGRYGLDVVAAKLAISRNGKVVSAAVDLTPAEARRLAGLGGELPK